MPTEPYYTAEHFADVFKVSVGTIYRWASEDGWPRTSIKRRPVRYSVLAAEQSWARRHAHEKT